jgi:hypothetical protein
MLMIAELLLAGAAYSFFSILALGAGLLWLLRRLGVLNPDDPAGRFATAAGLGFIWNALVFASLYYLELPKNAWAYKLCADMVVIGLAAGVARRELRNLSAGRFPLPFMLLLLAGLLVGCWAFFAFPHSLDSGEIRAVQLLLQDSAGRNISVFGYAGLAVLMGQLVPEFPVVTSAATFKPLLGMLVASVALLAAYALDLPRKALSAAFIFVLILLSQFGTYGVIELGKDSIFGITFSLAFILTLCREDADRRGAELAVYFAASTATGIIGTPYMLAAYVLWFITGIGHQRPYWTLPYLYAGNSVILPLALSGFLRTSPIAAVASYAIIGAMGFFVWLTMRCVRITFSVRRWKWNGRHYAFAIILLFAACWWLMPATVTLNVWSNADGSAMQDVRAPLDGLTDFSEYLLSYRRQNATFMIATITGFLACLLAVPARARVSFLLVAMPLAVLLGVLIRIRLQLPLLSNFNIWDLAKDIPQWYLGPLSAFLSVAVIGWLADAIVPRCFAGRAVVAGAAAILLLLSVADSVPTKFLPLATYTSAGGSQDLDKARLQEVLWNELRGVPLYIDGDSRVGNEYFFEHQMYGPVSVWQLDLKAIAREANLCCRRFGLVINHQKLGSLEDLATQGATVQQLAQLDGGQTHVLMVSTVGLKQPDGGPEVGAVSVVAGPRQKVVTGQIPWIRLPARVAAEIPAEGACLVLRIFGTANADRVQVLDVTSARISIGAVNVSGSSLTFPRELRLRLSGPQRATLWIEPMPIGVPPPGIKPPRYGLLASAKSLVPSACRVNHL